ncbi:transcriptional regulator, partial [Streptomyces asoensis]
MLAVTPGRPGREGFLTQAVRNVRPPHVSYGLRVMGRTLREAGASLL